jgi:hypothetical protein
MTTAPEPKSNTLQTVIDGMIAARLAGCHFGMPGSVVAVNQARRAVDVQPIIRTRFDDANEGAPGTKLPIIVDVPVCYPTGGGFAMTFPLREGDLVWMLFGEKSLDEWLDTGARDVDPALQRKLDLSDAIAIAGVFPYGVTWPSITPGEMVLEQEVGEGRIEITSTGVVVSSRVGAAKFRTLGGKVEIIAGSVELCDRLVAMLTAFLSGPLVDPITGEITGAAKISLEAIKGEIDGMRP